MLKKSLLLLSLFAGTTVMADQAEVNISLSQGYQRQKLDFSISGHNGKPNILSELTFKHIDIYVTRLCASVTKDSYFLKGMAGYGKIYRGKAEDNDYMFDNRKGEFSHSTHKITGQYTTDGYLRLGKHFSIGNGYIASPRIGYSAYMQKLHLKHGKGWSTNPFSHSGKKSDSIHGLNSTYRSTWYGPELGVELKKAINRQLELYASYTLLYPLKYDGKGHWNLRQKGERHFTLHNKATKSFGNILGVGAEWRFCMNWALNFEYEFMKFYAKGGHMKIAEHKTPMHKAHLTSNEIRLCLSFAF